jgi:hypothetical protein
MRQKIMVIDIKKGSEFAALCRYILDLKSGSTGKKQARIVGGNMAGTTYEELMSQFSVVNALRPGIKKKVWHCSLSLLPGETLSDEKWAELAAEFMKRMGFSQYCPYVVVKHSDKKHEHVHIAASRVGFGGDVWYAYRDMIKAIKASKELEEQFGLIRTKPYEGKQEVNNPTFSERQMAARTGGDLPKVKLQAWIDSIVSTGPTVLEFCQYLKLCGVDVRPNLTSAGKLNGFAFVVDGILFKGSSLGKSYSWAGLKKRGVTYDENSEQSQGGLKNFIFLAAGGSPESSSEESESIINDTSGVEKVSGDVPAEDVLPPMVRLQSLIDEVVAIKPTAVQLAQYLHDHGVEVRPNLAKTGKFNGFSFSLTGVDFKGSGLGKQYAWKALQERGVSYDLKRDKAGLESFKNAAAVTSSAFSGQTEPIINSTDGAEKVPSDVRVEDILPPMVRLQRLIDESVAVKPTAVQFARYLKDRGVEVRPNLAKTGKLSGFSFTIDGVDFKGSSLGKQYAWKILQERGVSYDSNRDKDGLESFKIAAAAASPNFSGQTKPAVSGFERPVGAREGGFGGGRGPEAVFGQVSGGNQGSDLPSAGWNKKFMVSDGRGFPAGQEMSGDFGGSGQPVEGFGANLDLAKNGNWGCQHGDNADKSVSGKVDGCGNRHVLAGSGLAKTNSTFFNRPHWGIGGNLSAENIEADLKDLERKLALEVEAEMAEEEARKRKKRHQVIYASVDDVDHWRSFSWKFVMDLCGGEYIVSRGDYGRNFYLLYNEGASDPVLALDNERNYLLQYDKNTILQFLGLGSKRWPDYEININCHGDAEMERKIKEAAELEGLLSKFVFVSEDPEQVQSTEKVKVPKPQTQDESQKQIKDQGLEPQIKLSEQLSGLRA